MNDDNTTQTNQQQTDTGGIFGSPMVFPPSEEKTQIENPENDIQDLSKENMVISIPEGDQAKDDDPTMGVTFVDEEQPVKQEVNIFSKESSFKHKEAEAVQTVIGKAQEVPLEQKPATTSSFMKDVPTKELEDDFSKTFNSPSFSHENGTVLNDPIKQEEDKLKRLHKELKEKASSKKIVVKERLEKLRAEKESLGKELEEIKEIESVALKIEEKLKALETIDTEIDSLETKAKEELQ